MDAPELPCDGDHSFGQGGKCECGLHHADLIRKERRTGGAGSRRQPLTDEEYSRQMRKLGSR